MHKATYVSKMEDGEQGIIDDARISNPGFDGQPGEKLLAYLIRNGHWSPFEMSNLKVKIETTRDIGRQLLRHWTIRPQEFSQRYADIRLLATEGVIREARMQDHKNRQNSLDTDDAGLHDWWANAQADHWRQSVKLYGDAIDSGIAKEVARAIMPEGMTPTVMKFNGPIRSWLHFYDLRSGHGTQREAIHIANQVGNILREHYPVTMAAWDEVLNA